MSYSIEITPQALNDIETAYRWTANNLGTSFVKQWYRELSTAIESLKVFPNRCSIVHEAEGFDAIVRQRQVGQYRILFTIYSMLTHQIQESAIGKTARFPQNWGLGSFPYFYKN